MPILSVDGKKYRLGDLLGEGSFWTLPVDEKKITVEILREIPSSPSVLLVRAEERVIRVSAERGDDQDAYYVELNGRPMVARLEQEAGARLGEAYAEGPVLVSSPMAGKIAAVKVSPGASVQDGQALVVLEAMKMENEIAAPKAGTVKEVYVQKGVLAKPGDKLILIE